MGLVRGAPDQWRTAGSSSFWLPSWRWEWPRTPLLVTQPHVPMIALGGASVRVACVSAVPNLARQSQATPAMIAPCHSATNNRGSPAVATVPAMVLVVASATKAFTERSAHLQNALASMGLLLALPQRPAATSSVPVRLISLATRASSRRALPIPMAPSAMVMASATPRQASASAFQRMLCLNNCSNNGVCQHETGTCTCFHGFSGDDCSTQVCPNDCSGHGTCKGNKCVCDKQWGSEDCSEQACPNDCSGYG